MKYALRLTFILLALASPVYAYAGNVFQCVNEEGITTFSFTPCAARAPVVEETIESEEPVISKKAELERLDLEILELRDEIDLVKREFKDAIAASFSKENSDELSSRFDSDTMRLISELNDLQTERDRVARL